MRHRAANPNLYLSMCHLFRRSVCFLERIDRIRSFKGKLGEVFASSSPLTNVRAFLGLCLYYKKSILIVSTLASPSFALKKKGRHWYGMEPLKSVSIDYRKL